MKYDPERHHRRSIRLPGYDYTQPGAYFVTIVTQDRACLFGDIITAGPGVEIRLNDAGRMVLEEWNALPHRFPNIRVDAFIVMPNHIHGIIIITDADANPVGAGLVPAQNGATTTNRATTRVAPTAATTQNGTNPVGAGLVPAQNGATTANRATTRVAPTAATTQNGTNPVGAGLVPAQNGATTTNRATTRVAPTGAPTVGDIVGAFKSITTVSYIRGVEQSGWPPFRGRLWLRNYYEHIVRDDEELERIRQYILDNPARWAEDRENPDAIAIVQGMSRT